MPVSTSEDLVRDPESPPDLPRWFRGAESLRRRVYAWRGGRWYWRSAIGLLGLLVVVAGIVLLPLPGPGWLIIFGGIAIWSTEFAWAARLLHWARRQVQQATDWLRRRFRRRRPDA
jgi:uncharacterized protein (TIGR02611 family)